MKINPGMLAGHRRLRGETNRSKEPNIDIPLAVHQKPGPHRPEGPVNRKRGDTIAVRLVEGAGTVKERVEVAEAPLLSVTDAGEKLHGAPAMASP
jgi:hypothetical protein